MTILIGGLAVYKAIHVLTTLLPKELSAWITVLVGVVLGIGASWWLSENNVLLSGLAMATIAGATQSVLRLVTLTGDLSLRRSLK